MERIKNHSMVCSKTAPTSASPAGFWISVNILVNKPHVVNKRLWGRKILHKFDCTRSNSTSWQPENTPKIASIEDLKPEVVELILKELGLEITVPDDTKSNTEIEVLLVELLPKSYAEAHAFQLVCSDKANNKVWFFNATPNGQDQVLCPDFLFTFEIKNNKFLLQAECDESSKSYLWLAETVLPQFLKWAEESFSPQQHSQPGSLTLVSNENYYNKYNELKLKYGKEMVKIWPECTDPSKFVYEDVAIATYLLLLWEEERSELGTDKLQSFVDLGCGNGLLVYILALEGHPGVGIDVRKRNIWDMYPGKVKLEEKTVTPSDMNLFPETDWLIGNHSDELTPWIPVVAARSSYNCKFFLLPCCAYNFDGTKYQRQNSSKSQYTEYLDHITKLCQECGFNTDVDRLKIPSTKRICIIGRGRKHCKEEHSDYCSKIQSLINNQSSSVTEKNSDIWIKDFKAREPVERVRNCTQIDKGLIESIIKTITRYLLEETSSKVRWSPGKTVDIHDLVKLLPHDELKSLKSECGGLQTLLKNNHHIFKVQSGKVQLRHPKSIEEINREIKSKKSKSKNIKLQEKPCWFFSNHPQGCPLEDISCSFLHVKKTQC